MVSAQEALRIIRESVAPLGAITLALGRARGFALACDIHSGVDVPPFDNSAMDGFALRAGDAAQAPCTLALVGEVAAGAVPARPVGDGEAMRIMTGAKIPEGCTAVVQHELTEMAGDDRVRILVAASEGQNIRRRGGDIRAGSRVLERGRTIRAQEAGILASLGERFVSVHRRPAVAILTTGDEVVDIGRPLAEGKIRNSNGISLAALVEECGADAVALGIARDDPDELRNKILLGLRSDLLLTSGGVSAGRYDLVIDVLKGAGVSIRFSKVNIKPGMPLVFGLHGATPVFGLPGNPVSSVVTFLQFVKPALSIMKGERPAHPPLPLRARLDEEITKKDGKRHFVRGVLESRGGSLTVRAAGSQVSNVLTSLAGANCLIILPEEKEHFQAGEEVDVELLTP